MDRLGAGLLVLLGLVVWWYAATFPGLGDGHPGPALFPRLVAAGLAACGLLILVLSRQPMRGAEPGCESRSPLHPYGLLRLSGLLTAVFAFPWIRALAGFIAAFCLVGFAVVVMLRPNLKTALPTILIASVLIYWFFTGLLGVPL